jgi:hypothetical protein
VHTCCEVAVLCYLLTSTRAPNYATRSTVRTTSIMQLYGSGFSLRNKLVHTALYWLVARATAITTVITTAIIELL